MKTLFALIRTVFRIGYMIAAWTLVAMVVVQIFHAGTAVLVRPGDWSDHVNFGHLVSLPIMLMALLSIAGWMPVRYFLLSLGLYALYLTQYLLVHLPGQFGLPMLAALHPVNALLIFWVASRTARSAWRLVTADWQPGAFGRRFALAVVTGACALSVATSGLPGDWAGEETAGARADSRAGSKARSLADATEESLPDPYRSLQSPVAPGDAAAVAAGQQIAQQKCISCHAADLKGRQMGNVRSADLTRSAETRSEQFLMWAVSEGSERGMPAWKSGLSEQERWQLVAFLKSLK